jgi:hypothetical protein
MITRVAEVPRISRRSRAPRIIRPPEMSTRVAEVDWISYLESAEKHCAAEMRNIVAE